MHARRLGRTGHESAVAVLGGAAFGRATPADAEAAFREALERGVNHLDVAPRYGEAEVLLGPLVEPVRARLFIGCKTTRRDPDGVRAQMEESLTRLRTERFDLYQLHAVTSLEVLEERFRAVETILSARDEGLTRFVGITGHDLGAPRAHLEALRRYDLDTVMFPVNATLWADDAYRRDAEALLEACEERDVGVMAIKAAARRPWDGERFATTWYEPFADAGTVSRCVRFVLSTPGVHAFCTPGDLRVLRLALDGADAFEPMSPAERDEAVRDASELTSIFPMPA